MNTVQFKNRFPNNGCFRGHSNQPGDVRGVALPAALDGYMPHQARALTSTLQNQFPLAPLPGTHPSGPGLNPLVADLPAGFAGLLSQPVPVEEPVEDWFVSAAEEPLV